MPFSIRVLPVLPAILSVCRLTVADGSTTRQVFEDWLVFANADQLFSCLGINHKGNDGRGSLVVIDCQESTADWQLSLKEIRAGVSLRHRGLSGCVYPLLPLVVGDSADTSSNSTLVLNDEACNGRTRFILDEHQRLQVLNETELNETELNETELNQAGSNSTNVDHGKFCLQRTAANRDDKMSLSAVGVEVIAAPCTRNATQFWVALPRGKSAPNARLDEVQFPLLRRGRHVIDAAGRVVRLRGVNWYGTHMEQRVNNGLDMQPMWKIARAARHLGFNHFRLNYAVAMWKKRHEKEFVQPEFVSANPELINKTELEIFDATVKAITDEGLMVIINSHTSDHRWCCSLTDDNEFWYNSRYSERDWLDSLEGLSKRYSSNPRVIGYDPRNEPRPSENKLIFLWWGDLVWGNCTDVALSSTQEHLVKLGPYSKHNICLPQWAADWKAALTQSAYAIWHGNPHALIFAEGPVAGSLEPMRRSPLTFKQKCLDDRIVWSMHDYTWAWRGMRLYKVLTEGGSSFKDIFGLIGGIYRNDPGKRDDWETFTKDRETAYTWVVKENFGAMWIGEFGERSRSAWWKAFMNFSKEFDLDWAYWSFDGYKYQPGVEVDTSYMLPGQRLNVPGGKTTEYHGESFGILNQDYASIRHAWKMADLIEIQAPVISDEELPGGIKKDVGKCDFDAELQPVVGTGPHPVGTDGYLQRADSETTCKADSWTGFQTPQTLVNNPFPYRRLDRQDQLRTEILSLPDAKAKELAALAEVKKQLACSIERDREPLSLRSSRHERAKEIWRKHQVSHVNPFEPMHRSSTKRGVIEAMDKIRSDGMKQLEGQLVVVLAIFFLALTCVCIAYLIGKNAKAGGNWKTPMECLLATRRFICCKCRDQSPIPRGFFDAASATEKWRPLVGVCYLTLASCIFGTAIFGLDSSVYIRTGAEDGCCSAMEGLSEALNGVDNEHSDFVGLLPALAHVANLTEAMHFDSPEWLYLQELADNMQNVSESLNDMRKMVEALRKYSAEECAVVTEVSIDNAKHSVEWGFARAVELSWGEVMKLKPKATDVLQDLRKQLMTANERLGATRDFLLDQFFFFYTRDPISWMNQAVQQWIVVLMAIYAVLITPTLVLSTWATVVFVFFDKLPNCCKKWSKAKFGGMLDVTVISPRLALVVWTMSAFFGMLAIGGGLLLQGPSALGCSACMAVSDLSVERLTSYARAFGLPTEGDSLANTATTSIIAGCFGDFKTNKGHVFEVSTCPAEQLPMGVSESVQNVTRRINTTLETLLNMTDGEGLAEDQSILELVAAMKDPKASANGNCVSSSDRSAEVHQAQLQVLRAELCGAFPGDIPVCDEADDSQEVTLSSLAKVIEEQSVRVDNITTNSTSDLLTTMRKQVYKDVVKHVIVLAHAFDCEFVRRNLDDVIDGLCTKMVVGLVHLTLALYVLGALCFAMSIFMYFLWVRLDRQKAFAAVYDEGARKASAGGQAFNMSTISRELAKGNSTLPRESQVEDDLVRTSSEDSTPQISPMEAGACTRKVNQRFGRKDGICEY